MIVSRLIQVPAKCWVCIPTRGMQPTQAKNALLSVVRSQNYASQSRLAARRAARAKTISEAAREPATGSAITMGRGIVAGASAIGIGALCFYGLGMSNEVGALERAAIWPQYVRDRIKSTYMCFGAGLGMTALSAVAIGRNPALLMRLMPKSWVGMIGSMAVVMGSGIVCMSVPYTEGFGAKHVAWLAHSSILGAILAPMAFLGGPLLIKAAWYTAGVVGGLSTLAACAPSDKFLYMGGPLAMGLGAVIVASIGGMFFPPTTALGSGLYAISVYGGVVLFGAFLLYDTQVIVRKAEGHPMLADRPYDPINAAMGIYMDTINIFIRIAMILSSGGGGKRK